ncbi:NADPH-dependent diflavin oxidoreductase 1 [Harmonia axyridis]|uniref:NADPH-dependent diflavin oxidoreductase 1 n=1 Tax=Harmonia axyridis TaxID=115357 RepID=UPI001E2778A0|nr:NADPH-dependent diflavin oxidoreductase 1 [Harmonia axyridis]
MPYVHSNLTILYGSQTGNAQDIAERIWRESKRYYFKSLVKSLDDYEISKLSVDECVIFICSTTGQGEVPDNMKKFWRFILRKNLPAGILDHLKYAVLGLGDSSYVKFNFTAKKLFKRLQQLGGVPFVPIGLGDDQHDLGYDAVTDPWIENLWKQLLTLYPLPENVKPSKNVSVLSRWTVTSKLLRNVNNVSINQSIYYSTRKIDHFDVTVTENIQLTEPSHFQDVRLIKFKISDQNYNPGDVIVVRPKNLEWKVQELEEVFVTNGVNFSQETIVSLKEKEFETPIPDVLKYDIPLRQLYSEYFDLMAIPRRRTFEILGSITDSELEREKCIEFTTAEGQEEFYNYCNRPKRNIVEVLQDFPNATKNLTLDILFEIFSPMKPREFSIASSCSWHKNEIHLLLAVVKFKTKLLKERVGLCSNFLAGLQPGDILTAWIRKGSFKFPTDAVPIIMVGPGTGLAPFRNYIFECAHKGIASANNIILFFGCRNESKDFLCAEELRKFHDERRLNLICAFSRDQEQKVYVQDKIRENNNLIWNHLKRKCLIFIAGNAKCMPQDVRQAFIDVCKECGNMTDNEAEDFISRMERENRYQTECW